MKIALIGRIIKQLREEQGMSLETLAERSTVSVAKIQEIEKGNITPYVGVMIKLSRALGARLGTLLDGQENMGAVVTRAESVTTTDSNHLTGGEYGANTHLAFSSLADGKKDRSMEPMVVDVAPYNIGEEPVLSEHEGEEFLYVLEGVIEIQYGQQVHILEKGDSIYYDSIVPHSISSATKHKARMLAVIYTPY